MGQKSTKRSFEFGPNTRIDVAGTGFTVLDRIFRDGRLGEESLGGSCGNVLVSLAMLQRRVAPILALGDDQVGERLVCEFARSRNDHRTILPASQI